MPSSANPPAKGTITAMIAVAAHSAAMTADCASSPGRSDPPPRGVVAGLVALISSIVPAVRDVPRRERGGSLEIAPSKLAGYVVYIDQLCTDDFIRHRRSGRGRGGRRRSGRGSARRRRPNKSLCHPAHPNAVAGRAGPLTVDHRRPGRSTDL